VVGQNLQSLRGLDAKIIYDHSLLEYKDASMHQGDFISFNPNLYENTWKLAYGSLEGIQGDGQLFSLNFLAKNQGDDTLSLNQIFINEQPLSFGDSAKVKVKN